MGIVANFANKIYSGIKKVGYLIWNGMKTFIPQVIEEGKKVFVGFVNGIKIIKQGVISLVNTVIRGFQKLKLFLVETLSLGLEYLSSKIKFGRTNISGQNENQYIELQCIQNPLSDNNEEENQHVQNRLSIIKENQYIQNPLSDNPDLDEEPKKRGIDLKNVFFEGTESYINEVINNPDYEPTNRHLYHFTLEDDIVVSQRYESESESDSESESESDSELNNSVVNVLCSHVNYEVINNNGIKLISLSFENVIEDIELGKRILNKIKDQLNRKYPNNVRVVETLDNQIEVEIEQITDIDTINMVIII